jgi:hypothetical protein
MVPIWIEQDDLKKAIQSGHSYIEVGSWYKEVFIVRNGRS